MAVSSVASHARGVSIPRRRTPLRSWMVLVLAVLGAFAALFFGGLRSVQMASASSAPITTVAAPGSADDVVAVIGDTGVAMAYGQWRSAESVALVGVTLPSPRVTPETSVGGSMRRPAHGTLAGQSTALSLVSGVPSDLVVLTTPVLVLLLGGAILVLRGYPNRVSVPLVSA